MNNDNKKVSRLLIMILLISMLNVAVLSTNFEYKFVIVILSVVCLLSYLFYATFKPFFQSLKKVYRNEERK